MMYSHENLIHAVDQLMVLGDFDKRVDATKKAGDIIIAALQGLGEGAQAEAIDIDKDLKNNLDSKSVDTGSFSL